MGKKIATGKNVNNKAGYVVMPISEKDIEKEADFGTFKITRTKECIAYTNYVGYAVITKPYTTTPEGKANELSLYSWLNYALENKEWLEAHRYEENTDVSMTNGEWLDMIKTITEANVTKPCVVFTDADYACDEAIKHTEWLKEKTEELKDVMFSTPPEEDTKANEEEFGRAIAEENLLGNIKIEDEE